MSDIRFACAECCQPLEADPSMAGGEIHCPQCTAGITIPSESTRPPEAAEPTAASAPPPIPKESTPPIPKKPSLFWRRVAAVVVDMLLLHVFVFIGTAVTGTFVFGLFLAWFGFFILWFIVALKRNTTPGKALAGIVTNLMDNGSEKSPRLLLRFAITWIPLLFLSLPAFELGQGEQLLLVSLLQWIALLWYVALLIGLVATHGKGGIQDAICKSESVLHITEALSGGRKAALWICTVVLIVETGISMLPSDEGPENGEAPNAVSYTHLDVYKRQTCIQGQRRHRATDNDAARIGRGIHPGGDVCGVDCVADSGGKLKKIIEQAGGAYFDPAAGSKSAHP